MNFRRVWQIVRGTSIYRDTAMWSQVNAFLNHLNKIRFLKLGSCLLYRVLVMNGIIVAIWWPRQSQLLCRNKSKRKQIWNNKIKYVNGGEWGSRDWFQSSHNPSFYRSRPYFWTLYIHCKIKRLSSGISFH